MCIYCSPAFWCRSDTFFGDSWCDDLGLAFVELFEHRVTQLQIPPDLHWTDHTSHCCKGILDVIDHSCADKDVCPCAGTPSGVLWSSDTFPFSSGDTDKHIFSLAQTIKLQLIFRAASQVRTAQPCLFVCFHNCCWVWFKTKQFTSLAIFS